MELYFTQIDSMPQENRPKERNLFLDVIQRKEIKSDDTKWRKAKMSCLCVKMVQERTPI